MPGLNKQIILAKLTGRSKGVADRDRWWFTGHGPGDDPLDLPPKIVTTPAAFAPLFSDRTRAKAQLLAVGALLATAHHTVCSALRVMGLSHERHFTNYHRVLNRDAWSCLAARGPPAGHPRRL